MELAGKALCFHQHVFTQFGFNCVSVISKTRITNCGQIRPHVGINKIFGHAVSYVVTNGEVVLRRCLPLLGGLAIPVNGCGLILRHSLTIFITNGEVELRICISLLGCFFIVNGEVLLRICMSLFGRRVIPLNSLGWILFYPLTIFITTRQVELRICISLLGILYVTTREVESCCRMSLFSCLAIPFNGRDFIYRYPLTIFITNCEVVLCIGIPLLGSLTIPLKCLGLILRNSPAIFITNGEFELRISIPHFGGFFTINGEDLLRFCMPLLGCRGIPFQRSSLILLDSLTIFITNGEVELRSCISLPRGFFIKNCKVDLRIGMPLLGSLAIPSNCISLLRNPHTVGVATSEVELCIGMPLLGSFAIPSNGCSLILRNPHTIFYTTSKVELRIGIPPIGSCLITIGEVLLRFCMPLLGCRGIPFQRSSLILLDSLTIFITNGEVELRIGIPPIGSCLITIDEVLLRFCMPVLNGLAIPLDGFG